MVNWSLHFIGTQMDNIFSTLEIDVNYGKNQSEVESHRGSGNGKLGCIFYS